MMLPIIDTTPVYATPVVYSAQRTLAAPQVQYRAAVMRSEDECVSVERMEKLEKKVDDLCTSFDDLREVVLQQAKIMNEISKRLPQN